MSELGRSKEDDHKIKHELKSHKLKIGVGLLCKLDCFIVAMKWSNVHGAKGTTKAEGPKTEGPIYGYLHEYAHRKAKK